MSEPAAPILRVVSGNPSPEELAALTAIVAAAGSDARAAGAVVSRGRWNDPAAQVRRPWLHGPGAWRAAVR